MLTFRQSDVDQMQVVQRQIVTTILPFREHTEAALVVFALLRCARTLLRLYPESRRKELTRVCVDFLEGRTSPRDDPSAGLLIMQ